MTSIEYAYVPSCSFRVKVIAYLSPGSRFLPGLEERAMREFDTSREMFEFIRGLTAEKTLRYQTEFLHYLDFRLERLGTNVRTGSFQWRLLGECYWRDGEYLGYDGWDAYTSPKVWRWV